MRPGYVLMYIINTFGCTMGMKIFNGLRLSCLEILPSVMHACNLDSYPEGTVGYCYTFSTN